MNTRFFAITLIIGLTMALASQPVAASIVETPSPPTICVMQHQLHYPLPALCALYKETGDPHVLELIERVIESEYSAQREQTNQVTDTIKKGFWWCGVCAILYLWWAR